MDNPIVPRMYIISVNKTQRLDDLLSRGSIDLLTEAEQEELYDESINSMVPAQQYFEQQGFKKGTDYNMSLSGLRVNAKLTLKQKENLKNQPFVRSIMERHSLDPAQNPKPIIK